MNIYVIEYDNMEAYEDWYMWTSNRAYTTFIRASEFLIAQGFEPYYTYNYSFNPYVLKTERDGTVEFILEREDMEEMQHAKIKEVKLLV